MDKKGKNSISTNICDLTHVNTVKDNPQLSDLKGPGTSKLDWRYFEHNKGTGTKMTEKLNNLTI